MSDVLIIAHAERAEALAASKRLVAWLEGKGHAVEMGSVEATAIGRPELGVDEPIRAVPDLAVSIGGDGTMLRSLRTAALPAARGR